MMERCLILNSNDTKNIVPIERIALVSIKETGKNLEATFYIDNAITVTLGGLTTKDMERIINVMQYKALGEKK